MTIIRRESLSVSRRDFLKAGAAVGAGLTVAIQFGCTTGEVPSGGPVTTPFAPDAFVRVSTDGSVTVVCGYSEMGQGVRSSLPILIAAELGA